MAVNPARTGTVERAVFALVGAAFTNIYVTQPVLPALEAEFGADTVAVARSVSMVLLGIALANLPFGYLADRVGVRRIIAVGGLAIGAAGILCALADSLTLLLAARFVQGAFIPALTTCLAAYLAKTLPAARLNVVMGSYVAATVLGGMLGRLLGGLAEALAGWRSACLVAAVLVVLATLAALRHLPAVPHTTATAHREVSYRRLLARPDLWRMYLCAAAGQAIFSPVFNTIAYRLTEPAIGLTLAQASLVYLVYLVGVWIGPASGRLSNRLGNGNTLVAGSVLLMASLVLLLVPGVTAIVVALIGVCAGFFAVHAAAVGALNRRLDAGQGRANALYVLAYYLGAACGVSWSAAVYQAAGWRALIVVALAIALVPLALGLRERRALPAAG
ncbi:MAG: MFS transporter [Gammaproteobacteria bacterium]